MKISNAFILGFLNLIMSDLQLMQNQTARAVVFGVIGIVILFIDLVKNEKS